MASQHDVAFIDSGERRAILVLVPELNLHGGYYERFAAAMAGHGIASHALDLRGTRKFADLVADIGALVGAQRLREPALPLFLLGHGIGSLAAGLHASAHPRSLAGLICESIALELPSPGFSPGVVRMLAAIAPKLPLLKMPRARFSRDRAIVERLRRDPLVLERLPAGRFAEMLQARDRFQASLAGLSPPLLVLHGSADIVTLPSGSEYLHEQAGSQDKTLQIFEGYYHDLINDLGHEHVVERIRLWMEARLNSGHRGQIGIAYINTDS